MLKTFRNCAKERPRCFFSRPIDAVLTNRRIFETTDRVGEGEGKGKGGEGKGNRRIFETTDRVYF